MIKNYLQQGKLKSLLSPIICLFISFLVFNIVYADALKVTPTRLTLSSKQPITLLYLTNPNDQSVVIQLQLLQWQQNREQDYFSLSHDVLVVPPIFRLPPHKTQLIRLALQSSQPLTEEKAYRLFIREVVPPESVRGNGSPHKLRILLRLSLPVFAVPTTAAHNAWQWTIKRLSNHNLQLTLNNQGNRTLFVSHYQFNDVAHSLMNSSVNTFAYILPHQLHSWQVAQQNQYLPHSIEATINHHITYSDIHVLS